MLYLVRHGRTSFNATKRLLGRTDLPLDDVGVTQAAGLARIAELHDAMRVVSSPLQRAVQTAKALGPPVDVDERWTEIAYGIFEGRDVGGAPELFEEWDRSLEYTPPGGESLAAMARRVRTACDALWEEAQDVDVVVVSHVSPIKAAVAWALGAGEEVAGRMFLDTASVTVIGPGREGPVLRAFNRTDHL